ncbi:hypothetical protein TNCV_1249151 [Trichonephila clavipes]|nr:hypothetical protein TNCV_1249151 [Trichonephila clavipes]
MLEKVIENWTSRLDYIRASRGSPMPEIIFKINNTSHTKLSGATAYEGQCLLCPSGTEVHEQMSESGGQSETSPPVLSLQASLVLIYRPTEGMKGLVDLAQPEDRTSDL